MGVKQKSFGINGAFRSHQQHAEVAIRICTARGVVASRDRVDDVRIRMPYLIACRGLESGQVRKARKGVSRTRTRARRYEKAENEHVRHTPANAQASDDA